MLTCNGCQRHVHVAERACPFCGTTLDLAAAPAPIRLGAMVLAMGLAVLGCDGDDDDGGQTTTTMTTTTTTGESGESGETAGEAGDGDGDTTDPTTDEASSDYGAPPPPYDADCWA